MPITIFELILTSSTIDKKLENFEFIFEFKIAMNFEIFVNFEFNFEILVNFEFIFEFFDNFEFFLSIADEVTINPQRPTLPLKSLKIVWWWRRRGCDGLLFERLKKGCAINCSSGSLYGGLSNHSSLYTTKNVLDAYFFRIIVD